MGPRSTWLPMYEGAPEAIRAVYPAWPIYDEVSAQCGRRVSSKSSWTQAWITAAGT